jgi:hypothetical protein
MAQEIYCPRCNLNDRIEKVSGITISQSKQQSSYSYELGSYQTTEVSRLAQQLMPPKKPELSVRAAGAIVGPSRKTVLGELGFGLNIVFFMLIGVCSLVTGFASLIAYFFLNEPALWCLIPGGIVAGAVGIGTFILTIIYYQSSQKKLQQAEVEHKKEINKWQESMKIWNRLYYCYRDHIVFDYKTGKEVEPNNLDLIYRMN